MHAALQAKVQNCEPWSYQRMSVTARGSQNVLQAQSLRMQGHFVDVEVSSEETPINDLSIGVLHAVGMMHMTSQPRTHAHELRFMMRQTEEPVWQCHDYLVNTMLLAVAGPRMTTSYITPASAAQCCGCHCCEYCSLQQSRGSLRASCHCCIRHTL